MEASNYPPGAESDPYCPWQPDDLYDEEDDCEDSE